MIECKDIYKTINIVSNRNQYQQSSIYRKHKSKIKVWNTRNQVEKLDARWDHQAGPPSTIIYPLPATWGGRKP